jgi:signal transduction histidine kinase
MKRSSILLLVMLTACATSYTPRTNSRAELQRYVERAADLVAKEGPAAACVEFASTRWKGGDYYIFVDRLDDNVLVCHPNAGMVGKDQSNLQDVNGKYITREMKTLASTQGRGWVEYMWPRPGETAPSPKSAYVIAVTGPDGKRYNVGSGGYNMPPGM